MHLLQHPPTHPDTHFSCSHWLRTCTRRHERSLGTCEARPSSQATIPCSKTQYTYQSPSVTSSRFHTNCSACVAPRMDGSSETAMKEGLVAGQPSQVARCDPSRPCRCAGQLRYLSAENIFPPKAVRHKEGRLRCRPPGNDNARASHTHQEGPPAVLYHERILKIPFPPFTFSVLGSSKQ